MVEFDTSQLDPAARMQAEMLANMLAQMETGAVVFFRDLLHAELEGRQDYTPHGD